MSVAVANEVGFVRDLVREHWVSRGYSLLKPGGLLSPAFPNEFNMSAGHTFARPILAGDQIIPSPQSIVVVERCLRRLDLNLVGYSAHHLSLLEMAVAARLEPAVGSVNLEDLVAGIVDLVEDVGLQRDELIVSCSGGGSIGNCAIPADTAGRNLWIKYGLQPGRVIMISGRRNLVFGEGEPHPVFGVGAIRPAGFSHEIFYPADPDGRSFVEIASINVYSHIQRGKVLQPALNRALGVGFGIERLAAVKVLAESVFAIEPLANLLNSVAEAASTLDFSLYRPQYQRLADRIRTIAFIIADGQRMDNSARARILSDILANAHKIVSVLGLDLIETLERGLDSLVAGYAEEYPHLLANREAVITVCAEWAASKGNSR